MRGFQKKKVKLNYYEANKRMHTERVPTLSVMMLKLSPSGDAHAVRPHQRFLVFLSSFLDFLLSLSGSVFGLLDDYEGSLSSD
jgi:hypothetical protein